jgi:hypothetical protein
MTKLPAPKFYFHFLFSVNLRLEQLNMWAGKELTKGVLAFDV